MDIVVSQGCQAVFEPQPTTGPWTLINEKRMSLARNQHVADTCAS